MALTNRQIVLLNVFGDITSTNFTGDELDHFISNNSDDLNLASADAALAFAGQLGQQATKEKTGTYELDATKTAQYYIDLSTHWRTIEEDAPATAVAEIGYQPFNDEQIIHNEALRSG